MVGSEVFATNLLLSTFLLASGMFQFFQMLTSYFSTWTEILYNGL